MPLYSASELLLASPVLSEPHFETAAPISFLQPSIKALGLVMGEKNSSSG